MRSVEALLRCTGAPRGRELLLLVGGGGRCEVLSLKHVLKQCCLLQARMVIPKAHTPLLKQQLMLLLLVHVLRKLLLLLELLLLLLLLLLL